MTIAVICVIVAFVVCVIVVGLAWSCGTASSKQTPPSLPNAVTLAAHSARAMFGDRPLPKRPTVKRERKG